jgi:hypothetical protein
MENVFDALSKNMAQVSRRQLLGAFVRGAVGAFLASTWLGSRSAWAQSGACAACGTCLTYDASTGQLAACSETCEAQTLCSTALGYGPYKKLTADLGRQGYKQTGGCTALIYVKGRSQTQVFDTGYVNTNNSSLTSHLYVIWAATGKPSAFIIEYQNGTPLYGYLATKNGTETIVLPAVPATGPTVTDVSGVSSDRLGNEVGIQPRMTNGRARSASDDWCDRFCEISADIGEEACSDILAAEASIEAIETGVPGMILFALSVAICFGIATCSSWCPEVFSTCSSGQIPCASGEGCCASCDSTNCIGTCVNGACVVQTCTGTPCSNPGASIPTYCCNTPGYNACCPDDSSPGCIDNPSNCHVT